MQRSLLFLFFGEHDLAATALAVVSDMTDKTFFTWFVVLFLIITAYFAFAVPYSGKGSVQRISSDAIHKDICVPPEIKALFVGAFKIQRISQWAHILRNDNVMMFFDSYDRRGVLLAVVQMQANGHFLVWARGECGI